MKRVLPLLALLACDQEPVQLPDTGPIIRPPTRHATPHDAGPAYVPPPPHDAGPAVVIESISPPRGSVEGGERVRIRGIGFSPDSEVTIGGANGLDTLITNERIITFRTPPNPAGQVDVIVQNSLGTATLTQGFEYIDGSAPVLAPDRGSIAGGTLVTVRRPGIGQEGVVVRFGAFEAQDIFVEAEDIITLRTPPGMQGWTDVGIVIDGQVTVLEDAFEYYNPAFVTGGVHGGDVMGSINITVMTILNGERFPVPDAMVWLGLERDEARVKTTNEMGQATLSGPDVYGPQTISAFAEYCDPITIYETPSEDITVYLTCQPPSPPSSGAPPPRPPVIFPRIQGTLTGFSKALFDPATLGPNERAFAYIDLTQRNIFSRKTPKATAWEQPVPQGGRPCTWFSTGNCIVVFGNDVVYEDRSTFDFITVPGRYSLVAFSGVINMRTQEIRNLRQMGFRRGLSVVFGETYTGQDIDLNYQLDESILVSIPDMPNMLPNREGPTHAKISTFLDFGGEGVYFLGTTAEQSRHVLLENMPTVPGENLTFYGGAYTRVWDPLFTTERPCAMHSDCEGGQTCRQDQYGDNMCHGSYQYEQPYTAVIQSGVGDLRGGISLGPVMQFPEMISPQDNGYLQNRLFQWRRPAYSAVPSYYHVQIYHIATNRAWNFYVPGHLNKLRLPRVPFHEDRPYTFPSGAYVWALTAAYKPDFNWEQWELPDTYMQYRRAWTLDTAFFTMEE